MPLIQDGRPIIYHSNRTVVHPDYAGLGMGIQLINLTSKFMRETYGYKIMAKFSSVPVFKAMVKQKCWRHLETKRKFNKMNVGTKLDRKEGYRDGGIKTFHFEYIGDAKETTKPGAGDKS